MNDETIKYLNKVWATATTLVLITVIVGMTAYNIADRIGPVRPIVSTSYQAK